MSSLCLTRTLLCTRPVHVSFPKRLPSTRWLSTQQEPVTLYEGPLANVAKKLKLFSITSLGLGTGISPFVFAIDVPVPFVAKAALVGVAVATSAASTGLIQWVMSPYVTRITTTCTHPVPTHITLHTLNFFAKEHQTTVPVHNLEPSTRIFTSWMVTDPTQAISMVKNKPAKPKLLFYVHPELCEEPSTMRSIVDEVGIGKGF
ncbi:hypothetical protein BDF14DRAFT_1798457 [Spinellus fusiger]|nr:hypothetical protein BDF14DRAFT_1798457 [Spinellus fusiger]